MAKRKDPTIEEKSAVNQVETKPVQMVDPGKGKAWILRTFTFGINPAVKEIPTKQQLFNSHVKQIEMMLWGDGLKFVYEVPPRIQVTKKFYKIFVLAEPTHIGYHDLPKLEKAATLNEILGKPKK